MPVAPAIIVRDKLLVARHVNQVHLAARQRQMREAEDDGHAPLLLFFEPVCLDARQRADERRLAVVHVPGDADRDVFFSVI